RIVSFYQHREKRIAVMHCVGEYPTHESGLQLNQIDLLRRRYANVDVGYSTHEAPGQLDAIKMAIAKGAVLFEKHVGVPAEGRPLNAYSADPAQVRRWLEAARAAISMAGMEGARHEFSKAERATLGELQRGVFARRKVASGAVFGPQDMFFALPAFPGQLVANDISKYTEYVATRDYVPNEAISHSGVSATDTRSLVHGIVRDVKALIRASNTVVPTQLELEISHHHGLENFRSVGSAMITVINREYCKRLVIVLPGQWHPEHWHTKKDETFHLLHGEIELVLAGERRRCVKNDVVVIPRGAKHEFRSSTGSVIEEISSAHLADDSEYTEASIGRKNERKTYVTNWMD
ncbi:MAG TPA: N-acetylneuraminate synthase family protein, partial [Opitutaceae bacterium]